MASTVFFGFLHIDEVDLYALDSCKFSYVFGKRTNTQNRERTMNRRFPYSAIERIGNSFVEAAYIGAFDSRCKPLQLERSAMEHL